MEVPINERKKEPEEIKSYKSLFQEETQSTSQENIGKRKDDRGMGKTSLARRTEWDWAKGHFTAFSVVFFVSLRLMKVGDNIEKIIMRQKEFLHKKAAVSYGKLRKLLETYGERCLLVLDGWGEHTRQCCDVIQIIHGEILQTCSVVVTSRSEFADEEEIKGRFNEVARCEGFPRHYAERFAKNILPEQKQVDDVLKIRIDTDSG